MRNAYNTYFEEEILSASPLRLVCLLYEKGISELRSARTHLAAGRVAERCRAIGAACDVIAELASSLDLEQGQGTALQLRDLYNYSLSRLLEANLTKQDAPLAEVLSLLTTLGEGWAQIARVPAAPSIPVTSPAVYAAQSGGDAPCHSWSF